MEAERKRLKEFTAPGFIWVMNIGKHAKLVYLYLCSVADTDGTCCPYNYDIEKACMVTRYDVVESLNVLVAFGLIRRIRMDLDNGKYRTEHYIIIEGVD